MSRYKHDEPFFPTLSPVDKDNSCPAHLRITFGNAKAMAGHRAHGKADPEEQVRVKHHAIRFGAIVRGEHIERKTREELAQATGLKYSSIASAFAHGRKLLFGVELYKVYAEKE